MPPQRWCKLYNCTLRTMWQRYWAALSAFERTVSPRKSLARQQGILQRYILVEANIQDLAAVQAWFLYFSLLFWNLYFLLVRCYSPYYNSPLRCLSFSPCLLQNHGVRWWEVNDEKYLPRQEICDWPRLTIAGIARWSRVGNVSLIGLDCTPWVRSRSPFCELFSHFALLVPPCTVWKFFLIFRWVQYSTVQYRVDIVEIAKRSYFFGGICLAKCFLSFCCVAAVQFVTHVLYCYCTFVG